MRTSVNNELELQRRGTKDFIDASPTDLRLSYTERVPNGSGGFTVGPPLTRLPQTFRLIPQGDRATVVDNSNGESLSVSFIVQGEYGCSMARNDWFLLDGARYEIVSVMRGEYQTKGSAVYRG